jgi:lysophospholipid acyltransferase (LPLAT)-like uncharacterized protein
MRTCLAQLGLLSVPLSEDPVERLKLLRDYMSRRPATFLVVDGRGPYFQVAPGIVSLARTLDCPLVPCSVAAVPHLLLPNIRVPISLPLPRASCGC